MYIVVWKQRTRDTACVTGCVDKEIQWLSLFSLFQEIPEGLASFRPSSNVCVKCLVFSLKYRLLSPPYFCYCKNWQKGTMIGLKDI